MNTIQMKVHEYTADPNGVIGKTENGRQTYKQTQGRRRLG